MEPTPESLSHLLAINTYFQILICLGHGCRCAVKPKAMSGHMRRKHQTPLELRKQVDRYIISLSLPDYNHLSTRLPVDGSAPQPIISIVDGFLCQHCTYKSQSRKTIREHANKEHGKKRIADEELFNKVRLQSWFWEGKERYWVVDETQQQAAPGQVTGARESRSEEPHVEEDSGSQEDVDDQILQEIKKSQAVLKEQRLVLLDKVPVAEMDAWLQYTGWNEVLVHSSHNIQDTYTFTRRPDADEPQLERLLAAWGKILERCLDTLEVTDHKDTLKWWASPKQEAASVHPFELPQSSNTIALYSKCWEGFLCYAMRTAPVDRWNGKTETGVEFSSRQWISLRRIRAMLAASADEDVFTEAEDQDEQLTSELMRFCQLVVEQDTSIHDSVYESPLMHYLAVLGIDPKSRTFRGSLSYTKFLASILYINRLIMLEVAVSALGWPSIGIPVKDDIPSIPARIHQLRKDHLCEASFSPTSTILSQLAMGKSFNKLHQSASNIHWSEDEQTVFYLGRGVHLPKIRAMCKGLIEEMSALLKELLFQKPVPNVELGKVVDSMAWTQELREDEYSFVKEPQNKELDVGFEFGLRRARRATGEWQMFKPGEDGQAEWMDNRAHGFLNIEKQFLRRLMVYVHVSGGQPARGPELGSTKVSNSVYSARGWYVINGRLCFLTMYDKMRKRRGNTEYIVRFLPDEISQLLTQYLVYVRPFARVVEYEMNKSLSHSEYLFRDTKGPWAGEELTRALTQATMKYLGVRLTVSAWRHVAIGIATRHLIRDRKVWEKDDEHGDDGNFADGDDEAGLEEATFQQVVIRQAGHGARVAKGHYAIDGAFLHRLGPELLSVFERASTAWHGILGLKSEGSQRKLKEGHRRDASQQLTPTHVQRVKKEQSPIPDSLDRSVQSETRAIQALKAIYGPYAEPKTQDQADALELVHQKHRSSTTIVIVLATSSGKSALFYSAAAIAVKQTVVVVVPFTALVDDILRRGREAQLRCEEWTDEHSGKNLQQLMVVGADRAVTGEFLHFATGLQQRKQLAVVYLDECHVALTDTSYREKLRELWLLRYLECPFICLTATLLVEMEGLLQDRLLIPHAQIFRRETARRSIRYSVQDCQNRFPSEVALEFLQGVSLPSNKRGIIYVRSYQTGDVIREALDCPFYKATSNQKSRILDRWIQGPGGWIVATGALGTGISISGVIYVVHVDRPYGLTSFGQQSGRGGREGGISDSVIIVRVQTTSGRKRAGIVNEYSLEQVDEEALTEFIQSTRCRRMVLAKHLDGKTEETSCSSIDGVFCDLCRSHAREQARQAPTDTTAEPTDPTVESGREIIGRKLRQKVQSDEEVFLVMDELKRGCLYCALISGRSSETHIYERCQQAIRHECSYAGFESWRAKVEFGASQHCWRCGLSQAMCRGLERQSGCEYPNIMMPSLYLLHVRGHLAVIVENVGFQGEYKTDFLEWAKEMSPDYSESNWSQTWRQVCLIYRVMKGTTKSGEKSKEEEGINEY